MYNLSKITGFEWDMGNENKNWLKHRISKEECEEIFFDPNLKQYKDEFHSGTEERYIALGKTYGGKVLYVAFTVRNDKIRVISARSLNRKEIHLYEK